MQTTVKYNDGGQIPHHVAIIMDGNGRWAKSKGKHRVFGHSQGANSLTIIVKHAILRRINTLSVFAFSSENWKRPASEVGSLLKLFSLSIKRELKELIENDIKIQFICDLTKFPASLQKQMSQAMEKSKNNQGLNLNVAVNYGGRWDIVNACKLYMQDVLLHNKDINALDEAVFKDYLSLPCDVDLLIRTGGEYRVSNFLLYQSAYAEYYFTDVLWPDFNEADLDKAIAFYQKRERRFGMISEQIRGQDAN